MRLSKQQIRKRCTDKTRYDKAAVAEREANRFGLQYYYCRFCNGFHLTRSQDASSRIEELLNQR